MYSGGLIMKIMKIFDSRTRVERAKYWISKYTNMYTMCVYLKATCNGLVLKEAFLLDRLYEPEDSRAMIKARIAVLLSREIDN